MKTWIISHFNNLIIATVAILSPVVPLLLTIGFLIVIDFIFGIYRAHKTGEVITSRKMGNTISKILLYNLMVLSVYFLDHYILKTGLNLEKIAASLIGIVELKSLDESFVKLFGWSIYEKIKKAIQRGTSTTKDLI
jgi:phage-related holin